MRLWFEKALLPQGWGSGVRLISDGDGCFASVETGVEAHPDDECHAVAVPGLPNVHSHAFQRLMAGRAESRDRREADSFWSWRTEMYRCAQGVGPEALQAIAAMAYVEMLEGGFTSVGEFHYLHHGVDGVPFGDPAEMSVRLMAAAETAGMRLTLLPVFYAHADFGGEPPRPEQARFVSSPAQYARLIEACRAAAAARPGVTVGVAPHSLRAVTPEELSAVASLAPEGPIHIHIAEQMAEVERCMALNGARPVEWLLANADVDSRWCLVHATHVNDAELAGMARSGAVVGLCPITEANLGDGIFPAAAFMDHGGLFGVGSDSNVEIDAAAELRLLEYGQRLSLNRRNVLARPPGAASTGRSLFQGALEGGCRALGVAEGLSVGAPATLVSLASPLDESSGTDPDAVLDRWVFSPGATQVDCVWSMGAMVVQSGRHLRREAIEATYRGAATAL